MKKILLLCSVLLLSACSTMQPPRYASSVDNVVELRKLGDVMIAVTSMTEPADFTGVNCRLMGPIEPADSLSFSEFITKGFNDEFKIANLYAEDGVQLTGEITKIDFSSSQGLTNGFWDIELTLSSSNGNSIAVANKFAFKSGFDAITACNASADALTPAVQDLIQVAITDPDFKNLLN